MKLVMNFNCLFSYSEPQNRRGIDLAEKNHWMTEGSTNMPD